MPTFDFDSAQRMRAAAETLPLTCLRRATSDLPSRAPLLISFQKNEILRVGDFLRHYRALGIRRFAIIDNNSTDGTFEFLSAQADVDLYRYDGRYTSPTKEAAAQKLIAQYGYGRWYLTVDGDEQVVFDQCHRYSFENLVDEMDRRGIARVRGLMVDMYANQPIIHSGNTSDLPLVQQYPYFDGRGYEEWRNFHGIVATGGARLRLFGGRRPAMMQQMRHSALARQVTGGDRPGLKRMLSLLVAAKRRLRKYSRSFTPALTKYPLFKAEPGDVVINAHFLWPYEKNFISPRHLGILHFKFLPNFAEMAAKAVADGVYCRNSLEYRVYTKTLAKNPHLSGMWDGSVRYNEPGDLVANNVIVPIGW